MLLKYDKNVENKGIKAILDIEFLNNQDGTMKVIEVQITSGTFSCDYVFTSDHKTLDDIIRTLVNHYAR